MPLLVIDGQDISRFTKSVAFTSGVHDANRVTVEMTNAAFDVTMPASVLLYIVPPPGYEIMKEDVGEGKQRIYCQPMKPPTNPKLN